MSWALSTNAGSLESLKISKRCGCNPKAVQMRRIVPIGSGVWIKDSFW